jgi:hypothetical protein
MLKRYLVFSSDVYYPQGGMDDFADSFHELPLAFEKAIELKTEDPSDSLGSKKWVQVFDSEKSIELDMCNQYGTLYETYTEFKEANKL